MYSATKWQEKNLIRKQLKQQQRRSNTETENWRKFKQK